MQNQRENCGNPDLYNMIRSSSWSDHVQTYVKLFRFNTNCVMQNSCAKTESTAASWSNSSALQGWIVASQCANSSVCLSVCLSFGQFKSVCLSCCQCQCERLCPTLPSPFILRGSWSLSPLKQKEKSSPVRVRLITDTNPCQSVHS